METEEIRSVNGRSYRILSLLGRGKGGYSYLAEREGRQVVLKQIHHEPCDYYSFGNKIEAERHDYERLSRAGIRIPRMLDLDAEQERIVKEYIEGPTVMELLRRGGQRRGIPAPGPGHGGAGQGRRAEHRLLPHQFRGTGRPAVLHRLRVQRLHGAVEL